MARRPPSPLGGSSRSPFPDNRDIGKGVGKDIGKGRSPFPDDRNSPQFVGNRNTGKGVGKDFGKGKGVGKDFGKGKALQKGTPSSPSFPQQSLPGNDVTSKGSQRPPSPFGGNVPRQDDVVGKGSRRAPSPFGGNVPRQADVFGKGSQRPPSPFGGNIPRQADVFGKGSQRERSSSGGNTPRQEDVIGKGSPMDKGKGKRKGKSKGMGKGKFKGTPSENSDDSRGRSPRPRPGQMQGPLPGGPPQRQGSLQRETSLASSREASPRPSFGSGSTQQSRGRGMTGQESIASRQGRTMTNEESIASRQGRTMSQEISDNSARSFSKGKGGKGMPFRAGDLSEEDNRPFRAQMSPKGGSQARHFPAQVGPLRSSPQNASRTAPTGFPEEVGPRRSSPRNSSRTPSPKASTPSSRASPRGNLSGKAFPREAEQIVSPKGAAAARLSPSRQKAPAWDTSASSGLARRIVHPLFSVMQEPPSDTAWKDKSSDAKPGRPMDVARRIADICMSFAGQLIAPSNVTTLKSAEGLPVEVILAGISMGLYVAGQETPLDIDLTKLVPGIDPQELSETWKAWKSAAQQSMPLGPLEHREYGFLWLTSNRSPICNLQRLVGAATTLEHGFRKMQNKHGIPSKSDLIMGTEIIDFMGDFSNHVRLEKTLIDVQYSDEDFASYTMREAVHHGRKVAILYQASPHMVAGTFLTGGCHGVEEKLCMQSNLFFSLHRAALLAETKGLKDCLGQPVHIPEYGVVLSPHVDVFRESCDRGYDLRLDFELAAVLSYSLPNRDPARTDLPLDERSTEYYDRLLHCKFRAALKGAAVTGAQILLVPALENALGNLPMDIGRALGTALCCCESNIQTVIIFDVELHKATNLYYKGFREETEEFQLTGLPPADSTNRCLDSLTLMPSLEMLTACKKTAESEWATTANNPMRSECAQQLCKELRSTALELLKSQGDYPDPLLQQIMIRHGQFEGHFPACNLGQCIAAYQNRDIPGHAELAFLSRSHQPFTSNRGMVAIEIQDALCAWRLCNTFRKDLEMVLYLYDDSLSGKLEESQLKRVLGEICGQSLTRDEMENILPEGFNLDRESISRSDFASMVARWHASSAGRALRENRGAYFSRGSCIKTCFPIPGSRGESWCSGLCKAQNIMAALTMDGMKGKLQQENQKVEESDKHRRQWLL